MFGYSAPELIGEPVEKLLPAASAGHHAALSERYFKDPHVMERNAVLRLEREDLGVVPTVRSPIRLQNQVPDEGRAPPALGDSTEEVLREIGLSDREIEELLSDGVVAKPG